MLDAALNFGDGWDGLRWLLAEVSLLTSLGYLALVEKPASLFRTVLKSAAIASLVPLPLMSLGVAGAPAVALIFLAAAFAFSSLGDSFLARKGDARNFSRGLSSFLVAHLFYLLVMVPLAQPRGGLQMAGIAVLIVLTAGTLVLLAPKLGRYRVPVLIYFGVISAMALAALSVPAPLAGLGALLFVLSDALIGIDRFRRPVPLRGPVIWITYYAGQVLIAASLLALLR